jgi:hypothetical protein
MCSHDTQPVVIAACVDNPHPWEFGIVYFDECDWPAPGYRLVKRITGCTKNELLRMIAARP